ncbi:MAG TPA: DUF4235 domain-containing protein [Gemmatimonadaceae bacterium]|nr:DUF4235 domain-containing protein [Gemmatimonadaceae bacterium]
MPRRARRKVRRTLVRRAGWTLVAAGAALVAEEVVLAALGRGWRAVRDEDPPSDPADGDIPWGPALAWTAASGVALALSRFVAQRGAAAGWRRALGYAPPR